MTGAAVAALVVVAAAVGAGVWLTRSHGGTGDASAQNASTSRDPSRFQMRPVLATGPAPCTAGQFPGAPATSASPDAAACYTLGPVALDGRDVASASTSTTSQDGPGVDLVLTRKGMDKFNVLAAAGFGRPSPLNRVALVLDGTVESAPAFQTPHYDNDQVRVSGSFTDAEARHAASVIAPPTPTTTPPTFPSAPNAITKPCRYFTLADAIRVLGPNAVDGNRDLPDRNDTCTYTTADTVPVSGAPPIGILPSLSVQLWHGRVPLASGTATSAGCTTCLPMTVRAVSGIGDTAAWYQLRDDYQTGPFPGGNLDVQVGATAMRITVDGVSNAEAHAEDAARVLAPRVRS